MKLFDVYPRYGITPVKGEGSWIWDDQGTKYLDCYGGHAVISVGHSHPHFVDRIESQLKSLAFYSNSVQMPIQDELAKKLGELSGYEDFELFLCNSGAEANENALKLASFQTGRKKVIVFEKGFHGRTSLAVSATDNQKIVAPINETDHFIRLPLNDLAEVKNHLDDSVAAVLIEGIQGISGIHMPTDEFLKGLRKLCTDHGSLLILDEIQSGYGRSGKFFAHQYAGIEPDIVTVAKGMGNGFPIGGVLIHPDIKPWAGMLGTTFGGNHLACAAGLAVLEILEQENLVENAQQLGEVAMAQLEEIPAIAEVRGLGLMIGIDLNQDAKPVRSELLSKHHVFVGSASSPETIRLLPSLSVNQEELNQFVTALKTIV